MWCETGKPDLKFARAFAEGVHAKYPGKLLAYNCSPSFNWKKNLDDATIAKFQYELAAMGYKFQFITLAGFHALNYSMFNLAHGYARRQMSAFVELQEAEFAAAERGFTAVKHQREVGTGYFDTVTQTIQGSGASTVALKGSTEEAQFHGQEKGSRLIAATRPFVVQAYPAIRAGCAFATAALPCAGSGRGEYGRVHRAIRCCRRRRSRSGEPGAARAGATPAAAVVRCRIRHAARSRSIAPLRRR